MTRRDYELITDTIKPYTQDNFFTDKSLSEERKSDMRTYARHLTKTLANRLAEDNKAFDKDRFLKDCGVEQ